MDPSKNGGSTVSVDPATRRAGDSIKTLYLHNLKCAIKESIRLGVDHTTILALVFDELRTSIKATDLANTD